MWIQLTECEGQTISLNSTHIVMIKEHGDRTLVVHARGEVAVLQSQEAILKALRLHQTEGVGPRRDRYAELH
jgi:uncharacterized protein YlzI (FlbEa/FlbD family)